VDILPEQLRVTQMGASMRLGAQLCKIEEGTLAHKLYGSTEIYERHRHRYEVNPDYIKDIEASGMKFSGISDDNIKMEIGELPTSKYHIGCQFHPEFLSRPERPAPLFLGLVEAAKEYKSSKED
jgi:CTP synthase